MYRAQWERIRHRTHPGQKINDDNNMFLTSNTLIYHWIFSLALKIPIQKDSSHKCHVANLGYKI
jgi:hypothetical protein